MKKKDKINLRDEQKSRTSIKSFVMKYRSIILTFFLDIVFASLAYILARTIMFFSIDLPNNYRIYEIPLSIASVTITVAMLVFFDCYNSMWKYAGRVEFFKFLLSYVASFAIIMLLKLVMQFSFDVTMWTPLFLQYLLFSGILSGGLRFIHAIVNYIKHIRNWMDDKSLSGLKRTIVIGAGYTGSLAINRFINNPSDGYFPVALIDDDPSKKDKKIYGTVVVGGMDCIEEAVEKYHAQAIVIAIMTLNKSQLKNIYTQCSRFNIPIKLIPAITNAGDVTGASISLRDIKIEELLGREEFKVRQDLIDISVKDKVVCVTGGAGSIGSELCRQALNFGCKHLVIFDQHENGMFELNQEFSVKYDTSKYTLVMGTMREKDKVREMLRKYRPEILFHAAAYKHVPMMEISPTEAIKNNVFGTLNVIEQAIDAEVQKFVLISTDKAVNPANVMGASKRIAEMLIETRGRNCKMQMVAVRFGNVLGSNGSVIPIFLKQIRRGLPITLTDRNIKRYFMTIPEAVRLVLQTGAMASGGEVFVLDMGEPVYIYDLACDLIRISGLIPEKDVPIVITGLRQGEKLFEELRYDKETVNSTQHEGIFVTQLQDIDIDEFNAKLENLKNAAFSENEILTVDRIFEIVPKAFRNMAIEEQLKSRECIMQGASFKEKSELTNNEFSESGAVR